MVEQERSKKTVMGSAYWEVLNALILFNGVSLANFGKMMYIYNIERATLAEQARYKEVEAFIAAHDGNQEPAFPELESEEGKQGVPRTGVLAPSIRACFEKIAEEVEVVREERGEEFVTLYGEFIVTCADRTIHATGGGLLGMSATKKPAFYYSGMLEHVRLVFGLPVERELPSIDEICELAEEEIRSRRLPRYGFLAMGAMTAMFGKIADMILPGDDETTVS